MGTYLLNLLTGLPLTGLPVVRISNFVYSVPVSRTPVNRTVRLRSVRLTGTECTSEQRPLLNNCHYFGVPRVVVERKFDCWVKLGFDKHLLLANYNIKSKITILLHKSTRLQRTNMIGPELFTTYRIYILCSLINLS